VGSWRADHTLNPKDLSEATVDWIFLVDTLNFSFWEARIEDLAIIRYNGEDYTGYWSLCAAVNRALQEGIPLTSAEYMKNVTLEQLKHIFRSENNRQIPMLDERVQVLRETGNALQDYFGGSISNCIKACKGSAQELIKRIVSHFPSYSDTAVFAGKKVLLYKRVQILVADLWACFEGQSYGYFEDIDIITMFADYRVPQGLAYIGALQYSEKLMDRLREGEILHSGNPIEVEIRGNSIWAVALIKGKMNEILSQEQIETNNDPLNDIVIDFFLWGYTKKVLDNSDIEIPIHKVRSVYY